MKQRDWERDIQLRQRNIVFPDTVQNQGRFYRNILRTRMQLSPVQKAGITIFAVGCLTSGTVMLASAIAQARAGGAWLILSVPVGAAAVLPFALSWKLLNRAIFDAVDVKPSHQHKNLRHPRQP